MKTCPDLLAQSADRNLDKVAFYDEESGRTLTYNQLVKAVGKVAGMLTQMGVSEGDRVAVLCRNRVEFFELLFACARIRAILVPLNWRMPANELIPIVTMTEPAVMFTGAEDAETATEVTSAGKVVLVSLDEKDADGFAAHKENATEAPPQDWQLDACWYLLFTSGTTGTPKAVIQTYGMALVNYINLGRAVGLVTDDVTLNFLPLFHTAGINLHTLPALFEGASVRLLPGFDEDKVIKLIRQRELNTFFAVPTVYQALAAHKDFADIDLSAIRSWGCGGAPLPSHLLELYQTRGVHVCNGMGMTETGPTLFLMSPDDAHKKPGSVGKPPLMSHVRLVAEDGTVLQGEAEGELQISGPGITPGYWRNDEATKEAFTEDGWLKSGDIARRDADGFWYIIGRSKDMYISGGENVYPAEVENVLAGHPAIEDAAIIGVPDEKWGEVGKAFIQFTEGHSLSEADIITYARQHLAPFKVPKHISIVSDFPRTAAGKIQKHLIEDEASE
jgi:fatty-acyl-CoA synthase